MKGETRIVSENARTRREKRQETKDEKKTKRKDRDTNHTVFKTESGKKDVEGYN